MQEHILLEKMLMNNLSNKTKVLNLQKQPAKVSRNRKECQVFVRVLQILSTLQAAS